RIADGHRNSHDEVAPCPGLGLPGLDQLAEALEVASNAPTVDPDGRSDLLGDALRRVAHVQPDPAAAGAGLLEADGPAGPLAVGRLPRDPPVGLLLDDLLVPLGMLAADGDRPVQHRVVELLDLVDPVHEARELFELRPLV